MISSLSMSAQTIATIAGTGSHSHTGDGGLAIAASIGQPYWCAFDIYGNFYFSDDGAGSGFWIRKITPCGIITTVAGIGTGGYNGDGILATSAKLNGPSGIAFDSLNNMYIADAYNYRIRKVDATTGIITTVAGNGTSGFSGDSGIATAAMLNVPYNICFDRHGNLYITDIGNERIRKVNTSGIITTFAGTGTAGYSGDSGAAVSAEIENLWGICADTNGNIFFDQQSDDRVRKIDTAGIITTIAGNGSYLSTGDGGPAIDAGLDVFGLVLDQFGNLFVAGYIDNDVRKINATGVIYTVAGNGTAGFSGDGASADLAELYSPYGIAVDPFGNLYIADAGNSRIRKVTFNPVITPTITITASPGDTICSSNFVTFTTTVIGSSTSLTYQWFVNGSPTATGNTYSYIPTNGDSVSCILSVNGLCAMPHSNTINIVVNPTTSPAITIGSVTGDTICSGTMVTDTVASTNGGTTPAYQWIVNGSSILVGTGSSYTYAPANGDSVRCVLTSSMACALPATASSNTINMVVNIVTTPTITITAPAAAATGSVVSVNAIVAGPASYSIRWYDNGVLFNTTTVPMVTYTKGAGVDNITATVVASEGCYDSSMSAVAIVTATTETSPSFGSAQDRLEVLRTYPNPVHNLLYVAISNSPLGRPGGISYRLMSMVGSVMREGVLKEGDNMMWVEQIPVGVYMLEVVNGDGGKTVRKIVKE